MFGRVINGVADGVVAMNALKLGSACDCMVAIYIRVFPTRRAGVGRAVNWKPQPVLKRDSEILWDDRETKIGIRNLFCGKRRKSDIVNLEIKRGRIFD